MARILAYTSPARGHLFPLVPILDELRRRGHEIALRTLAPEVERMRTCGFDADSIARSIERIEPDDYLAKTPQGALKRALRTFARRAEQEVDDLQGAIAAVEPELLLVDVNTWGAQAVAERSGLPWATWCPYPLPVPSRDVPPFGPGFPPARGVPGRLRDAALRPVLLGSYGRALLPLINEVRDRVRARRLQDAVEAFTMPPLVLYMTAEPFEYPRSDWPQNIVMVGPCAWEPSVQTPPWLEEIQGPIVLVTTSSEFQDDGRLVRTALEALVDEPVTVVATLPAGDPGRFALTPNARLEKFVPHRPVLERAICAVTHGGMGATQKALACGVPVCAVPFGRDQLEVARRVVVAGAGTRLPARRLNPERLRAQIKAAIDRSSQAQALATAFAAAGGPPRAADALEERLLGNRRASLLQA